MEQEILIDFNKIIEKLFQSTHISQQPNFLVEIDCQDGTLLHHAYQFILTNTNRGKKLPEYPLEVIALITDPGKIDSIRKKLGDIPHRIGHISDTSAETILDTFNKVGVNDYASALYLLSSFKHSHLKDFTDYSMLKSRFGFLTYSKSKSFDQDVLDLAGMGWFPVEGSCFGYPNFQSNLIHFEQRSYIIRSATLKDLPLLRQIEDSNWSEELRIPQNQIKEWIQKYPEGQLVIQSEEGLEGIVYSQRIFSIEPLRTIQSDQVHTLFDRSGPIIQLIALFIKTEMQHSSMGGQLLEFVLNKAAVTAGVTHVTGLTRCVNFPGTTVISMEDYLKKRNAEGELVDPVPRMHVNHGAEIKAIVRNYRPKDIQNDGCGILIVYTLATRNESIKSEVKSLDTLEFDEMNSESIAQYIDELILNLLENCGGLVQKDNRSLYSRSSSLMEMGLDSLQLLELRSRVSEKFLIDLEPAFFFQYNTADATIKYLVDKKIKVFQEWFYEIQWRSSPLPETADFIPDRLWIIFSNDDELSHTLTQKLLENNQYCITVTPGKKFTKLKEGAFEINSNLANDFILLFQEISPLSQLAGIVYLWNFKKQQKELTFTLIDEALQKTCGGLTYLANALATLQVPANSKLWVINSSIVSDGSMESLIDTPLNYLCKIVREEYPKSQCSHLAIDSSFSTQKNCSIICNELNLVSLEPQIAWRNGQRQVARMVPSQIEMFKRPIFTDQKTYLISGGFHPLGLQLARWTIEHGAKNIVLLDEIEMTTEIEAEINVLKSLGANIKHFIAKFDDLLSLEKIFLKIKKDLPPLKGIMHTPGIIDQDLLLHLTWDRFKNANRLKIAGSWHLHELTKSLDLDHFILFSTCLIDLAPYGKASYLIGNSFLDALSYYRRHLGLPSLTIDWGLWPPKKMTIQHLTDTRLTSRVKLLNIDEAFLVLENIFYVNKPQLIAAQIEWKSIFRTTLEPNLLFNEIAMQTRENLLTKFEFTGTSEDLLILKDYVKAYVQEILGLSPSQEIPGIHELSETIIKGIKSIQPKNVPSDQISQSKRAPKTQRLVLETITQFPLTSAQERMWFFYNLEPDQTNYNIDGYIELQGNLNIPALMQAINAVVQRHDALRATFHTEEGRVYQIFEPEVNIQLTQIDLIGIDPEVQKNNVAEIIRERRQKRFDLTNGPLLRTVLISLSKDRHIFGFEMHHICSDGYSFNLFYKEIGLFYEAYTKDEPVKLAPLDLEYKDYTLLQKEFLESESYQQHLAYWKKRLADVPQIIELQTDKPRSKINPFKPAVHPFHLSRSLRLSIEAFARTQETTPFNLFISALALLLHIYSRDQQVNIGVPIVNRHSADENTLIGLFVNTVVMNFEIDTTLSVAAFLNKAFGTVTEAISHQQAGFEDIVKNLHVERDVTRHPLFQVSLNKLPTPVKSTVQIGELKGVIFEAATGTPDFDLAFEISDTDEGYYGEITYNCNIFDAQTIERLQKHYFRLIETMIEHSQKQLNEISVLSEKEKDQIIYEWNKTSVDYPLDATVAQLFEQQVKKTPDRIAAVFKDTELTYQELDLRSNQLAHFLRSQGVGPQRLVGICMERSIEMIVGLLGILKSGGAYVAIDPDYPVDRLDYIIENSAISVVLTQSHLKIPFANKNLSIIEIDHLDLSKYPFESLSGQLVNPHQTAYVLYTSGSTGKPKGVDIPHVGLTNRILWMQDEYKLNENDAVLQKTPYSFDVSGWEFFWPLISGSRLVFAIPGGHKDPDYLINLIQRENITTLHFVPSMFEIFLQTPGVQNCSRLRYVFCSGEELKKSQEKTFFKLLPQTELHNLYGPTEASIDVTYFKCSIENPYPFIPIGRAVANTQLYILDKNGHPLPIGVPGELYIAGVQLANGYYNRPDLTSATFIKNPFSSDADARMYKTGDLCCWLPDGNIKYLGRIDFQIKLRGFRVELGEIEGVLRDHPEVKEAAVAVYEDPVGVKRLVSYIIPQNKSEKQQLVSSLREYVASKLPEYMVPSAFTCMDEFPLTNSGKLDRKRLPAPEVISREEYTAPRTEVERTLCKIWQDVLQIKRVGIKDNFFELGGDSIISIQIISIARQKGIHLKVADIFKTPTIEGLSQSTTLGAPKDLKVNLGEILIKQAQKEAEPYLQSGIKDAYPLSPAQKGILFTTLKDLGSGAYVVRFGYLLKGDVRSQLLKDSWEKLVEEYDILRTSFLLDTSGQPIQIIHESVELPWIELNWEGVSDWRLKLENLYKEEGVRGFNLDQAPLIRFYLIRLPYNRTLLVWVVHHILLDGWSGSILIKKFLEYYHRLLKNQELPPPSNILYRDYISYILSQPEDKAKSFWQIYLKNFSEPSVLAVKKMTPVSEMNKFSMQRKEFVFDAETARSLSQLSKREGMTLNSLFLGIWGLILKSYTGKDDVVFGNVVSGRAAGLKNIQEQVGLLINAIPFRIQINQAMIGSAYFKGIQENLISLQEYDYASLEQIQGWTGFDFRTPLIDHLFIFENFPVSKTGEDQLEIEEIIALEQSNYHLNLYIFPGDNLTVRFDYNEFFYDGKAIEKIILQMNHLLNQVIQNIKIPIGYYEILTSSEKQQILIDWNRTEKFFQKEKAYYELFEDQVKKTPDKIAVVYGSREINYRELNERANQLAHHLEEFGIKSDQLIGICLPRSEQMLIAILAVSKSGAAYVPLDPAFPLHRLSYMVNESDLNILVTSESLKGLFSEFLGKSIILEKEDFNRFSNENLPRKGDLNNLVYVIYTSGSTGKPKGVLTEHHSLTNFLLSMQDKPGITPEDAVMAITSLSFDPAGLELFLPIISGAQVIIAPEEAKQDVEMLAELIKKHQITLMQATPTAWTMLFEGGWKGDKALKVLCGGEALKSTLVETLTKTCKELWNMYGPTEATVWPFVGKIEYDDQIITVGRPIANTTCYILDPHQHPLPVGVRGEIYIGGAGVARGYLKHPELTEEKFISDPFTKKMGERIYRTGDLGRYLPDGRVECLGRVDHQVKIRGYRIELGEIESQLNRLSRVRNAVVIALHERLVSYIIPEGGDGNLLNDADLQKEYFNEIKKDLKDELPDYMIPSTFVLVEFFPLTPTGKVDRKALPEPEKITSGLSGSITPCSNPTEEQIYEIWKDVLGRSSIGVDEDFFDGGGSSMLAVRIFQRMNEQFPGKVRLADIFSHPTIQQLAEQVMSKSSERKMKWFICEKNITNPKQRVFCFHHAGGSAGSFKQWKRFLPDNIEFQFLQLPGREQRHDEPLCTNITVLVDEIVKAMKEQMDIPYILFGHSMGGMIASEVLQELKKRNYPLPKHLVLSSIPPLYFLENIEKKYENLNALDNQHFIQSMVKRFGLPQDLLNDKVMQEVFTPILRADFEILNHRFALQEKFKIPITTIFCENDKSQNEKEIKLWKKATKGSYNHLVFPGEHMALLTNPKPFIDLLTKLARHDRD